MTCLMPREGLGVVAFDFGTDAPLGSIGGDDVGQLGFARGGLRARGLACRRGPRLRLEVLQRAQRDQGLAADSAGTRLATNRKNLERNYVDCLS